MSTAEGLISERHNLAAQSPDDELLGSAAHAAFASRSFAIREPWDACFEMRMHLSVYVPMPRISLQQLLGLKAGQVLEADWPASQDVPLLVEEQFLATGELEPVGDKLGVRINGFTEQPRLAAALSNQSVGELGAGDEEFTELPDARRLCSLADLNLTPLLCFGEASMPMRDVLGLCVGDSVLLNRGVVAPVNMAAGGRVVATGDLLLIDGGYAIRVSKVSGMTRHLPAYFSAF